MASVLGSCPSYGGSIPPPGLPISLKGLYLYNYMSIIREDIKKATLKKIKDFLKKQKKPVYKSDIARKAKVDYNSLNFALKMLSIKIDREGRVKLC